VPQLFPRALFGDEEAATFFAQTARTSVQTVSRFRAIQQRYLPSREIKIHASKI
jgi:hypothetical protein